LKRTLVILTILLMLAASIFSVTVNHANAENAVPKPPVVEFSLKYVDFSYTTPVIHTYTMDPLKGQQDVTTGGQFNENQTIEVIIKNPAVTSYINAQGVESYLYYNITLKGHFDGEDKWLADWGKGTANLPADNSSDYTIALFNAKAFPDTSKIDFRVQAQMGYYTMVPVGEVWGHVQYDNVFSGVYGDYSPTQTFDLTGHVKTPTPHPIWESIDNQTYAIIGLGIAVAALSVAIVVLVKKRNKNA
jgi:hypothetical protein